MIGAGPGTAVGARPDAGVRRLLVAGTAGGAGTTTVTALLFAGLRDTGPAPFLIDHTGGDLGPRVPGGDEVAALDQRFGLHDLGRNVPAAVGELGDPGVLLMLVTAATPVGRDLAAEALQAVAERFRPSGPVGDGRSDPDVASRVGVVQVECFGRRSRRPVPLPAGRAWRGHVVVPRDEVLAAGGPVPANRLGRPALQALHRLTALVRSGPAA